MPHGVQALPRPFRQLTAAKLAAKHSARFTPAQAHREDDLTTVSTWMGKRGPAVLISQTKKSRQQFCLESRAQ